MFKLMLIACVGVRICEYQLDVEQLYPTENRCAQQAAIIAGVVHGRFEANAPLKYRYACTPVGAEVTLWMDGGLPPASQKADLRQRFPAPFMDLGG